MAGVVSMHRVAVVVPAGYGDSRPGTEDWEAAVGPIRARDVGIWVLTAFGPLSERFVDRNPFLFEFDVEIPAVQREACLRIATWIRLYAPLHERVVLVGRGPFMQVWSDAVRGLPEAEKVEVLPLPKKRVGLRDTIFRRRLSRRVAR